MRKIIYSIFFCFICLGFSIQPSSSINFAFKLYYAGKKVASRQLCSEFNMSGTYEQDFKTCDTTYMGIYRIQGYFITNIGSIYPPYILHITKDKETMTICFPVEDDFVCDSLPFLPGNFVIDHSYAGDKKIKPLGEKYMAYYPLKNVDWEVCRKKYQEKGCTWQMKIKESK
jgi:hypothetical protein